MQRRQKRTGLEPYNLPVAPREAEVLVCVLRTDLRACADVEIAYHSTALIPVGRTRAVDVIDTGEFESWPADTNIVSTDSKNGHLRLHSQSKRVESMYSEAMPVIWYQFCTTQALPTAADSRD